MIKANELRIGNCHRMFDNHIGTITAQGILYVEQGTMTFEPVLMTPEIFKKCGSNKDMEICFPGGWINFDGYIKLAYGYFVEESRITSIRYLHEFQNLYFALTGKELTINL